MVALKQTITVPQSRQLMVQLPETVSVGSTVTFTVDVAVADRKVNTALLKKQLDECQQWAKDVGFTEDMIPDIIKEARRKMYESGH